MKDSSFKLKTPLLSWVKPKLVPGPHANRALDYFQKNDWWNDRTQTGRGYVTDDGSGATGECSRGWSVYHERVSTRALPGLATCLGNPCAEICGRVSNTCRQIMWAACD